MPHSEKELKAYFRNIFGVCVRHIDPYRIALTHKSVSECKAVESLFGQYAENMVLNSTKSMTGHLLGAGPAIESIAILMSMRDDLVHPTINIKQLDPRIPQNWNFAASGPVRKSVNVALSNSFGFGGHNVTLLYKKFVQ